MGEWVAWVCMCLVLLGWSFMTVPVHVSADTLEKVSVACDKNGGLVKFKVDNSGDVVIACEDSAKFEINLDKK